MCIWFASVMLLIFNIKFTHLLNDLNKLKFYRELKFHAKAGISQCKRECEQIKIWGKNQFVDSLIFV